MLADIFFWQSGRRQIQHHLMVNARVTSTIATQMRRFVLTTAIVPQLERAFASQVPQLVACWLH